MFMGDVEGDIMLKAGAWFLKSPALREAALDAHTAQEHFENSYLQ